MSFSKYYLTGIGTAVILFLLFNLQTQITAQNSLTPRSLLRQAIQTDRQPAENTSSHTSATCLLGDADGYPCENVNLLSHLPLSEIGGGKGNDIWGWTDPDTGKEYALMGRTNGLAFVDISSPTQPIYLGTLPPHTSNSIWRDIKVHQNHAFIVSEASNHGMQVFDLTQLRNVPNIPTTFTETTHYADFGSAHNIVINTDSSFAYAVGTNNCSGGLHMIDIHNPLSPSFAGCFSDDGYTHDAQCVNYHGPDTNYSGREICFNANEDTLTIVDVTDKASPVQLARQGYAGSNYTYTHQGWLTEDHAQFVLSDESDESTFGVNTTTYIWSVSDLTAPSLIDKHTAVTPAIDHNLYIHNGLVYQANYRAGLRILNTNDITNGKLNEIGYFDIYPSSDSANFNGAWSVYPFFPSGNIIVSGIEQGLFVLEYKENPPTIDYDNYIPFISNP